MAERGYFYLHKNGQVIYKRAVCIASDNEDFDSPFVVRYWPVPRHLGTMMEELNSIYRDQVDAARLADLNAKFGRMLTARQTELPIGER